MIKGQKINKNLNRNYIASNFNSNIKCHQSRQQRRITNINPTAAAATKTNVKNKKELGSFYTYAKLLCNAVAVAYLHFRMTFCDTAKSSTICSMLVCSTELLKYFLRF